MASTMTDVSVLLFVVICILLLSAVFDHLLTIIYTRPSTQEGRTRLTAIEDMVLPMGSFPSRLLNPWSSTPKFYNSSPLPPASNNESKHESVPAPDETMNIQDGTNEIPTLSFSPVTTIEIGPVVDATSPAVINELAEFRVSENEIRGLVDPKGVYPSQSKGTRELVADMINKHAEDVSDMRHDSAEEKEKFERKIESLETECHDLNLLYEDLSRRNVREEENSRQLESRNKCLEAQIEEKIQMKGEAEQKAHNAGQLANARVQRRIDEVKVGLEHDKKAAVDKIEQEPDSVILLKRSIENELAEARKEVNLLKEQQKTSTKVNTATLNYYKECLRQRDFAVTTSEQLAGRAERELEALKNEKLSKDSVEITSLKKQLHESKDLAKSLESWQTKAENHERMCQRLRENLTEKADDIRKVKDHKINDLELDIGILRRDMATDEITIDRLHGKIAKLKSGQGLQELKSQIGQAKKQLQNAGLETEDLRKDLRASVAKSKQDAENAENAMREIKSQHEEEKRTEIYNAVQQAERAAAEKATEKEVEYEQRVRLAVKEARDNATVEAAKEKQQHALDMRATFDEAMNNAAVNAANKEHQYELAMRAEVEEAKKKAVAEIESKAKAESAAAEAEKQAAKETEMDIEPDPELDALLMEGVEDAQRKERETKERENEIAAASKDAVEKALENAKQQHQNEKADAVQDAVRKALEDVKQQHQKKKVEAVQDAVRRAKQDAKVDFEKEKNDLIAAKEAAEVALQAQEKVTRAKSSDVADSQTSNNPIDLTLAATEADEVSKLLEDIVQKGMVIDTVEHSVLRRLTNIRVALHNVKATLQMPNAPTERSHYQGMLRGSGLEEFVLERLESETNHKLLVRQGRLANERLKRVSAILQTSGVQKDAILQALIGPKRQVAPMRGLKRSTPSKNPKADDSQPSADAPPTPSAKPKANNHQSFASLMKSLNYY